MSVIAPCITVESEEQFKAAVERIQPFAKRVHIDISDGEFAPVFLLATDKLWWPKEWVVDIHAMVARPTEHVDALIALKPNLITFHVETGVNLPPIMDKIRQAGIKAGIALLKQTVPMTVAGAIGAADHVMIFSGDLGHYGGTASMMQLEKVRLVRAIKPNVEIGWDGGVSVDNAYTLTQGGVDVLNVGGAIANSNDPAGVYVKLEQEISKRGVI
ncbi:MAG TPA: hypothetical protein PK265_03000 [Candidatus Saccharibacteria bacterium]|nr:hypothetical protein [Candidatus Saccharibacteria bacterium]HRQ98265.1 hypothetical protein [Candidatus Saccharibacteria bacterium]